MTPDPRTTLIRDGVAAGALEGIAPAARYVAPAAMQASAPATTVRSAPEPDASAVDQLLFGEPFEVLEEAQGFAFGQAGRSGYVGWVTVEAFSAPVLPPSHRVTALRTYAFAEPDIKSAPVGLYSLNALVSEEAREGRFVQAARAGWIVDRHLAPVGLALERDWAAVAQRFVGAPYLWGGRESLGLDCSGLVQAALLACGIACPRDSDQQRALGRDAPAGERRPGDLAFWPGHVGIVAADDRLLHANAHWMAVVSEPWIDAVGRMGEPQSLRRLG